MSLYNTNNKLSVIALLDDRIGNRNQVLAVLKELKLPYKILEIDYNWIANFPNFILQVLGGTLHIKKLDIKKINIKPKLFISCGRRTFPVTMKLRSVINPLL